MTVAHSSCNDDGEKGPVLNISEHDQDIIDSIVGTLKDAQRGDAEDLLRPHVQLIPALCDALMAGNPGLRTFVQDIGAFVSREAIKAWSNDGSSVWNELAEGITHVLD